MENERIQKIIEQYQAQEKKPINQQNLTSMDQSKIYRETEAFNFLIEGRTITDKRRELLYRRGIIKQSKFSRFSCNKAVFIDVEFLNVVFQQNEMPNAVFINCTFTSCQMVNCDFRDTDFIRCTFSNVNTAKCVFNHITIFECDHAEFNLNQESNQLSAIEYIEKNQSRPEVIKIESNHVYQNTQITSNHFSEESINNSQFIKCSFARLDHMRFENCMFLNCELGEEYDHIDFIHAQMTMCVLSQFSDCTFDKVIFQKNNLDKANFIKCYFNQIDDEQMTELAPYLKNCIGEIFSKDPLSIEESKEEEIAMNISNNYVLRVISMSLKELSHMPLTDNQMAILEHMTSDLTDLINDTVKPVNHLAEIQKHMEELDDADFQKLMLLYNSILVKKLYPEGSNQ